MVATHIFHKLVFSASLYMKKASGDCCALMFDSSSEPAVHAEVIDCCAAGCSGTEFEVGCTTSRDEGVGATVSAPMDYESSMNWFNFCIRRDFGRFSSLLSSRSTRSPSS